MSAIKIINLDELIKATSTKQLKEKNVQIAIANAQIAEDTTFDSLNIPINFGIKAGSFFKILSIKPSEIDDDKVVGKDALLAAIPAKVWLKYTLNANAAVKAGGKLQDFGLKLEANQVLQTSTYCLHSEEDTVMKAVSGDLIEFINIFSKTALLKKMQVGEAVSLQITGGLEAGITAKWGDIFSQSLSSLTSLLNTQKTLAININSGLQAAFKVTLTDNFVLRIAKTGEDEFKIVLKKDLSKTVGLQAFAGVEVAFDKPENVDKVFTEVLEGLLGTAEKKLDEIIRKIKNELKLEPSEELLLKAVLARLGEEVNVDINLIPNKIAAYKQKVRQTITDLANSAIKAGFTFEYQRNSANSELLVAKLNSKSLDMLHWDLLKFNLLPFHQTLAEAAKNGVQHPDIKVESYLNSKTTVKENNSGFSFRLGKFLNISSKSSTKEEITERKNEKGERQFVYLGENFYEGEFFGKEYWGSVFSAQQPDFSQKSSFDTFNYEFSLLWKPANKKAKENDIVKIVDIAAVWKCIDDSGGTTFPLSQELNEKLEKAKDLRYAVSIKIGQDFFPKLLKLIAQQSSADRKTMLTKAFAIATPYHLTVTIRQDVPTRTRLYLPLWEAYINGKIEDAAMTASEYFRKLGDRSTADYERNENSAGWVSRFANNIHGKTIINKVLDDFAKLHKSILAKEESNKDEFNKIIKNLNELGEKSFTLQVFGAYLMELLESQGLLTEIERIFTIQYKEGNEDKTLNLTQGLGGKVI